MTHLGREFDTPAIHPKVTEADKYRTGLIYSSSLCKQNNLLSIIVLLIGLEVIGEGGNNEMYIVIL